MMGVLCKPWGLKSSRLLCPPYLMMTSPLEDSYEDSYRQVSPVLSVFLLYVTAPRGARTQILGDRNRPGHLNQLGVLGRPGWQRQRKAGTPASEKPRAAGAPRSGPEAAQRPQGPFHFHTSWPLGLVPGRGCAWPARSHDSLQRWVGCPD